MSRFCFSDKQNTATVQPLTRNIYKYPATRWGANIAAAFPGDGDCELMIDIDEACHVR
jgi:hypothetical protein